MFTRDQIRRAEELQAQAPLLFPTTATPVVVPLPLRGLRRAEIQRQLETYDSRQRVEIQSLQQEIFSLRAEREALRQHGNDRTALVDGRSGSNAQGMTSLASSIGQSVAKAVRPLLPVGLLHSTGPEDLGDLVNRHVVGGACSPGQSFRAEPAADAVKALERLRSWSRWSRRSEDLGLARPDPTILARGLTTIVQPVLEKDYEANFRTSFSVLAQD